ncbi:MAG: DUF3822 family protein [Chitinophagaceae bacterium]
MLKATFDIVPASGMPQEWGNTFLLMEVGEKTFNYVVYNRNSSQVLALRQYSLDFIPDKSTHESLQEILKEDEWLQQSFREAFVIYNYADSNLLPERYFHIDMSKPATELVYGNARRGLMLSEKVQGWNLYNIYRIPRETHALLQQKFAAGKYWHYYTLFLTQQKNNNEDEGKESIHVIVAADQFVVAVFKEKKLALLQTYGYQTPDDVSFHLLAICSQLQLNPEEVKMYISGLIDEQSTLYLELLKYFLQLEWELAPARLNLPQEFSQYPQHYFSPLMKMALCV